MSKGLKELILEEQNIYNAIFALRSYVFERGLLSKKDVEVYHKLTDKYDFKFIETVINDCKQKLKTILETNELFVVDVYFKLKKFDNNKGGFVFRPIHTASLIDQICMVCMLMPLMFNDQKDKRQLSELSKLIPHNFYGNLPSVNVDEIFIKWQTMYKSYSEKIIAKSQECKDKQLYKKEVCLDLQDFFPSINPAYIYDLVKDKMKLVFNGDDLDTLEIILTKLLYFHIRKEKLNLWESDYYSRGYINPECEFLTNRGIAQGLPQSYYFGNLMMLKVSQIVEREFPGESYYYVDDSVVFTNAVEDHSSFVSKINTLNEELQSIEDETVETKLNDALHLLSNEDKNAQKGIKYGIKYHTEGKSFCVDVYNSYSGSGGLQYLTRQVSQAAVFSNNFDDVDDNISKDKLQALIDVIGNELVREKKRLLSDNDGDDSQLKLLKRYRRFFLYRLRLLKIREDGFVKDEYLDEFQKRFQIYTSKKIDYNELQQTFEEEIFQTECRLIIRRSDDNLTNRFIDIVKSFEQTLSNKENQAYDRLYYCKDLEGTLLFKFKEDISYTSISSLFKEKYGVFSTAKSSKQKEVINSFLYNWRALSKQYFPGYTSFILNNSEEFSRKIFNTFFSILYCIDATDRHSFSKYNNRSLNYSEVRVLAYLRNDEFTKEGFTRYAYDIIQNNTPMELMKVDMALMEVLHVLITSVKNPLFIDNIILTHRLVSGLWKNGSKFLNAYTLHNEEHAITLIYQCLRLLKVVDYIGIKQNDYYVLFLACYLHDISMVINPNINDFKLGDLESEKIVSKNMLKFKKLPTTDIQEYHEQFRSMLVDVFTDVYSYFENDNRKKHPKESATYIKKQHDAFLKYIDDAILEYVALISESHGFDVADVYGRKSKAKNDLFSIKYMMILIRLADLMDMSNERVNYYRLRQNLESLSDESKFHWTSHLITDRALVTATYKVNPDRKLIQHPIKERLQIKLFLNVDYSATFEKGYECWGCQATHNKTSSDPDESDYTVTSIVIKDKTHICNCSRNTGCPIICCWMMKKNYWLVNELIELRRYLNQTNTRLFDTEIEMDLLYKDSISLDTDMFDVVRSYLEEPRNKKLTH